MQNLQDIFEFDDDALQQNQVGQLTDEQRAHLDVYLNNAQKGIRAATFALIVSGALLLGAWILSNPLSRDSFQAELTVYLIFALVLLSSLLYGWNSYRVIAQGLTKAEIQSAHGKAKKYQKKHPRTRLVSYHITIGEVYFQLDTKKKWDALDSGMVYQVYYIDYPPSNIILSIRSTV